MKTKIFISSSSGLDTIPHQTSITVIPDVLVFSGDESYLDGVELNGEGLYQRLRNDKTAKVAIMPQKYTYIEDLLKNAIKNNYERFFFILSTKSNVDYSRLYERIKEDYSDFDILIYRTNTYAYPMAYVAITADKLFKDNLDLPLIYSKLDSISDNYKLYFFSPQEDVYKPIKRIDFDEDIINQAQVGVLSIVDKHGILNVRRIKNKLPLEQLLGNFLDDIQNISVIPFIIYTNRYSAYAEVIENRIMDFYPKLKGIKRYLLPSSFGNFLGMYSVGVGYIKKEE